MMKPLALCAALVLLFAGCAHTPETPNKVFGAQVKSQLEQAVIPVYLPSWIPAMNGSQRTLYASVTLYPQGYFVSVDPLKNCYGAKACSFIALTGRSGGEPVTGGAVTLHDGTAARFVEVPCGVSCAVESLAWSRNQYTYGVQMKNGDEATLVRIADSFVPLN